MIREYAVRLSWTLQQLKNLYNKNVTKCNKLCFLREFVALRSRQLTYKHFYHLTYKILSTDFPKNSFIKRLYLSYLFRHGK